ncbi:MAG: hypothetical protein JNL62_04545 [Bryobacterales bacterium]|nr:hypothetical protein [Bryobacterales bacterium]
MTQSHSDDQLAVVLGQRQLIAVCCMFLVTMGLVATLAYVSGRSISAAQLAEGPCPSDKAKAMVVEPASATVPTPLHAQAEPLPPPNVPIAPPVAATPVVATKVDAPPAPGSVFWQVGVVDRGIAGVFVEHLTRMGLRARSADVQTPGYLRVLVGPLATQSSVDETKRLLDKWGFQAFLKKY